MLVDQILGIGFLMGLIGSAHCIGMCGPLVMGLPIFDKSIFRKSVAVILYHIGKLLSYTLLGVFAGLFGKQIVLINTQQHLSIIIGVIMLVYVLWVFIIHPSYRIKSLTFLQKPLLASLSQLFRSKQIYSYLLIGLLNGLLPCGMVYLALGSAMATGSIMGGALFMLFFGLGTVPSLLLVVVGGQYLGLIFRKRLQAFLPVIIFMMGVVLILRGMNLGIPFISPQITLGSISCHN